jgi:hypothetical protein
MLWLITCSTKDFTFEAEKESDGYEHYFDVCVSWHGHRMAMHWALADASLMIPSLHDDG